jgi:hypothetical protein
VHNVVICDGPNHITSHKSSLYNEWGESQVRTLDLRMTHKPCASQLRHHDVLIITSPLSDIYLKDRTDNQGEMIES